MRPCHKKKNKKQEPDVLVTPLITVLWRQRQRDFLEFEVNLVYVVNSKPDKAIMVPVFFKLKKLQVGWD